MISSYLTTTDWLFSDKNNKILELKTNKHWNRSCDKMQIKEYRICMPLSVEEVDPALSYFLKIFLNVNVFQYKIGQLYMIAKHSAEQSQKGEGVEVVENRPHEDPEHGKGQFTEKRIYISSKLPSWIRKMVPKIFYVTEKAWNYYPFTITEYSVSLSLFLIYQLRGFVSVFLHLQLLSEHPDQVREQQRQYGELSQPAAGGVRPEDSGPR